MATKTHLARQEEAINETGVQVRASDPGSPFLNQTWLNTTENKTKWYDGSSVRVLSEGTNVAQVVGALDIDWNLGNVFSKSISADTTFTFSNLRDGQVIHVAITADASNRVVTFPTLQNSADLVTTILASKTVIYSFARVGGNTICLTPVRNEAFYGA